MDPLLALEQQFTRRHGRAPTSTELGDTLLAMAIAVTLDVLTPQQILARTQQMLTPGTPLNTFLRGFK